MRILTYTLVADGSSDRCLLPIITWVLTQGRRGAGPALIDAQFADLRELPGRTGPLSEKIKKSVEEFPCDVLFVHRDAERGSPDERRDEIRHAAEQAGVDFCVCLVPVRMTEAWLLFDEQAIRRAAGNPNGKTRLKLPRLAARLETEPDPKALLHEALELASEATGRRLKQFQRDIPPWSREWPSSSRTSRH